MECPHCAATLPDDDLFCEECGVRLTEPACTCGASAEEIDEDGFCTRCGRRVRPRPEDHMEIVISPDFAAVTDRGLRHDRNEDRVVIRDTGASACAGSLLVVCDGVSSSTDSQTAASTAVETISELLCSGSAMEDAFAEAAKRVADLGPSGEPPSTTAIAALVKDTTATVGWVGDSRAYWINSGWINSGWIDSGSARQLTKDHSWLNDAISSGEMSFEQASADPRAHAITRWLGGDSGENSKPDIINFEISGPGALLLCTDGLWNYAPADEDIAKLMGGIGGDAIAVCRALVDFAKEQGGHDNITAALLRFAPEQNQDHGKPIQG